MSTDGWAAVAVLAVAAVWSVMRWWTWNRWREKIVHRLNKLIELQQEPPEADGSEPDGDQRGP